MVFSGTSDVICCFDYFILFCCYINLQQEFVWWFKIQINHINFIQIKHSISLQWIQTVNHEINKVASSCLAHKDTKTLIILVWEQYEVRGRTGTSSRTWQSNGNTTIYTIPVIRNWLVLCELDRAIQSDSRSLMKICQYLRIVLFNVNPSQSGTMDNGGPGKLTGSTLFLFSYSKFSDCKYNKSADLFPLSVSELLVTSSVKQNCPTLPPELPRNNYDTKYHHYLRERFASDRKSTRSSLFIPQNLSLSVQSSIKFVVKSRQEKQWSACDGKQ